MRSFRFVVLSLVIIALSSVRLWTQPQSATGPVLYEGARLIIGDGWRAENHTPANVLDHLRREAFYGVAAATSVGTSPIEQALQMQRDQQAGKFPPAARFLFMPGMAPPKGGPDAVLIVATNQLGVINEVSTPEEARARVRRMAEQKIAPTCSCRSCSGSRSMRSTWRYCGRKSRNGRP
jgi:hypothetical protein